MNKYAKIINQETKEVQVGMGTNIDFYKSIGMTEMEVEQAYNGNWYVQGYAPEQPAPTEEEQRQKRAMAYRKEKDPITCQIQSLKDEEQTEEVVAKIQELIEERRQVVEKIQRDYPYPVGEPEYEAMD